MRRVGNSILCPSLILAGMLSLLVPGVSLAAQYDLVIGGGRVIDPASGLDATRNIGLRDGKIHVISKRSLSGRDYLDASGLVVAPGFIDLHAHGQNQLANRYQARDGVTTALELEMGEFPLKPWYASRRGKALINYGASVSHALGRARAMHEQPPAESLDLVKDALGPQYSQRELDSAAMARLASILDQELADGGLGIGIGLAYLPGARRSEIYEVYRLAATRAVPVFVHARVTSLREPDSVSALQELIANTALSGAASHVCHIGSAGGAQVPQMLEMISAAQARGLDISTEVYPYTAAHTFIGAAIFSGQWQENIGMGYSDLQWTLTGERLTRESFERFRRDRPEGSVIAYFMPESAVDMAVSHPGVIIASDGGRWENRAGHPRGAGTFSRVLGRYTRERKLLDLNTALAKMTLLPAARLASFAPAMRNKGRLAPGADADITIFNAQRVIDMASYEEPMQFSIGIQHVLVNGVFVVRDGKSIEGVYPGRAIVKASEN